MRTGICLRFDRLRLCAHRPSVYCIVPQEHDIPLTMVGANVGPSPGRANGGVSAAKDAGAHADNAQIIRTAVGAASGLSHEPRAGSSVLCPLIQNPKRQAPSFWRAHHSRTSATYNYTLALQSNRGDVHTHGRRIATVQYYTFSRFRPRFGHTLRHILFRGDQPIGYRCSVGSCSTHNWGTPPPLAHSTLVPLWRPRHTGSAVRKRHRCPATDACPSSLTVPIPYPIPPAGQYHVTSDERPAQPAVSQQWNAHRKRIHIHEQRQLVLLL
jgi:hypothetical protein